MPAQGAKPRPLIWRGTSKADFAAFPREVQRDMGYALFLAQMGESHRSKAKTLRGFGGGAVVEVRESHAGNAYRAIYTVRFADAVTFFTRFKRNRSAVLRRPKLMSP